MHCNLEADREMMNAARALPGRRPWMPLLSAVLTLGEGQAELIRHAERPWTSVTFAGTRHTIVLAFTGPEGIAAGEAFITLCPIMSSPSRAKSSPMPAWCGWSTTCAPSRA